MFSKIVLFLAFIASLDAKTTTKPVAPPTKKPVVSPTAKPIYVPTAKPQGTKTPTSIPSFKPSTLAPTIYIKTSYSKD